MRPYANLSLLWASPREILNLIQAEACGCHIITMTPDLLAKIPLLGRDLNAYSLDTVRMFHADASAAGYHLNVTAPGAPLPAALGDWLLEPRTF